jgi:hypothetical protein
LPRSRQLPTSSSKMPGTRVSNLLNHVQCHSLMPVYGVDYRVHLGRGPKYNTPYVDYDVDPYVMYWFGRDVVFDFVHEIGHVVNKRYVPKEYWELFTPLLWAFLKAKGETVKPQTWYWDRPPMKRSNLPDPWCEAFADKFSRMQLQPSQHVKFRRTLADVMESTRG